MHTEALERRWYTRPSAMFAGGLALRVACILIGHTYRIRVPMNHFGFGWEMGRIAQSLALGQGYANPFNGPSGATAWVPPLYPLLIALSFKLFGIYTNAAALFLLLCNSVFSAAVAPAVYEIAARVFDAAGLARRKSRFAAPVALWSGWLWALYPAALQYAIHWIWEMSLSTCLFSWALVFALRLRGVGAASGQSGEPNASLGNWLAFGALWGAIALSNASLLLVFPAAMVWVLWPRLRAFSIAKLQRPVLGAALACIAFGVILTPWVVRNERALHAFVPTRSNLGVELYESTLTIHNGLPWGTAMPLWKGDPAFKQYVQMGEVPFATMRGNLARARIRANPGQFVRFTIQRITFFWDDTPHPVEGHPAREFFRNLSYAFLSYCGLLGLGLALYRRVTGAGLIALCFLLIPLPYYIVTVQPRFRHPIEPLIAILGVYLFRSTTSRSAANVGESVGK